MRVQRSIGKTPVGMYARQPKVKIRSSDTKVTDPHSKYKLANVSQVSRGTIYILEPFLGQAEKK